MDLYSICRSAFHSNNFVYSPIAPADVDSMFEMSRLDGYNDFLSWYPPADRNGMAAIIDGWVARRATGKHASYAIRRALDGHFVGRVALSIAPEFPMWLMMSCEVHPQFWGGAVAREATLWMQWAGYERLGAWVVYALADQRNMRARRFLSGKAGLEPLPIDSHVPAWMPPEPPRRLVAHAGTRKEWARRAAAFDLRVEEVGKIVDLELAQEDEVSGVATAGARVASTANSEAMQSIDAVARFADDDAIADATARQESFAQGAGPEASSAAFGSSITTGN